MISFFDCKGDFFKRNFGLFREKKVVFYNPENPEPQYDITARLESVEKNVESRLQNLDTKIFTDKKISRSEAVSLLESIKGQSWRNNKNIHLGHHAAYQTALKDFNDHIDGINCDPGNIDTFLKSQNQREMSQTQKGILEFQKWYNQNKKTEWQSISEDGTPGKQTTDAFLNIYENFSEYHTPIQPKPSNSGSRLDVKNIVKQQKTETNPKESVSILKNDTIKVKKGPTIGEQKLKELENRLPPKEKEKIQETIKKGFFPIVVGDDIVFMSNPSYVADKNGKGTSYGEALEYAKHNGYRLPTKREAGAFRNQAHIIFRMARGTPGKRTVDEQKSYEKSVLDSYGMNPHKTMHASSKIWIQEPGVIKPGLNGGINNAKTGDVIQQYSTAHNQLWEDYSQQAQFVALKINTNSRKIIA